MPTPPSTPPERDPPVSLADEPTRVVGGPDAGDAPTTAPLPRGLLVLLGVAGAAVSIAGLRSAAPTFLALVIVISVHPLPAWLRRHGLPAWAAVVLAMVCTYAILLGLVGAVVLSVTPLATLLPAYQSQFTTLIDEGAAWLDRLGVTAEQINSVVGALDPNSVLRVLQRVIGRAASITSDLLFIFVLIFFLILDSSSFPDASWSRPSSDRTSSRR